MAKLHHLVYPFIFLSLISSLATASPMAGENHVFFKTIDRKLLGLKEEKLSHLRLYWHDIVTGPNPSSVLVVQPQNFSTTAFGMVRMIDNPLTIGPEMRSKIVGRAQGFYAQAAQQEIGLLMAMNFAFTQGQYNGSTITILGRNSVFNKVREMPVVGGSGVFRFARGYVEARTSKFNISSGDATVEYNIYMLHY